MSLNEFVSKYFVQGLLQRLSADYRVRLIRASRGPSAIIHRLVSLQIKGQEQGLIPLENRKTAEDWTAIYTEMYKRQGLLKADAGAERPET